MTGSGWFDSAHGLQVYHFYPFTPLALRLGVVFYFLDVMPMFCPYPTTCIFDRYRVAGVHSCSTPVCPFRMQAKTVLEQEIALLEGIRHKTEGQKEAVRRLRSKYKAEFGGDAMNEKRGGGHAPPD